MLAEFQLSSSEEIKRWLRGFGSNATVLEPLELRQEIAAELREMLAVYGPTGNDGAVPRAERRSAPRNNVQRTILATENTETDDDDMAASLMSGGAEHDRRGHCSRSPDKAEQVPLYFFAIEWSRTRWSEIVIWQMVSKLIRARLLDPDGVERRSGSVGCVATHGAESGLRNSAPVGQIGGVPPVFRHASGSGRAREFPCEPLASFRNRHRFRYGAARPRNRHRFRYAAPRLRFATCLDYAAPMRVEQKVGFLWSFRVSLTIMGLRNGYAAGETLLMRGGTLASF
ncbi:MAG TPA: WYL domain-containing protein [Pirellulales bacterium]|nr:WYL domain-containing protein [Pirellulales bacterium]